MLILPIKFLKTKTEVSVFLFPTTWLSLETCALHPSALEPGRECEESPKQRRKRKPFNNIHAMEHSNRPRKSESPPPSTFPSADSKSCKGGASCQHCASCLCWCTCIGARHALQHWLSLSGEGTREDEAKRGQGHEHLDLFHRYPGG